MRILYGDLIAGISGDMFAGALLDLGFPLRLLSAELKKLPLRCRVAARKKRVHGIRATRFLVRAEPQAAPRPWPEIRRLLERSGLEAAVKERAIAIFAALAQAEAKVHGVPAAVVHFHEVGAIDSIVDIVAAALGTHHLKIDRCVFSPVPLARGLARSRHGPLPAPGPATLQLLRGIPVRGAPLEAENVTPTGAAIVAALGAEYGELPSMTLERVGYGAGEREFADRPNVLRLLLGSDAAAPQHEEMLVLESHIDDMNPEIYDYLMERLFAAGARDVALAPIQMKKNRPGTRLTVIAEPRLRDRIAEILFRETSTIGLRYYPVRRIVLPRESRTLKTRFGEIRVKVIEEPGGRKRMSPEYEDLKRIAARRNLPLKSLYEGLSGLLGGAKSRRGRT